ncbi:MAG: M20 family metallopeptidase [Acidimicrobiaceae bacterium]|nr:M20/M25/M40 family metallo-hydrolase [Acidimicrobiaceae bacterium]MDE0516329.1 M20/M25/M40 family metallo-hydrolase [Acidimicrobiaceae bacterium]MDE0655166.1 M20/M25/M40 family metallo-hydrolase [Acidimicrobiaceae bacterium]MXZ94337.1 M20 family metallopeptidase [Acidimicrobiaceae bacterium]MYF43868.1 M20 family metallopeptidase [Acidimicrobiaceae bacterium]
MSALDDALARVSSSRLRELTGMLVATPTPTGEEGALAVQIAESLNAVGLQSRTQWLDANAANAWGVLGSDGCGPSLLLYSPIDTLTAGDPDLGLPWASPQSRPDMEPEARTEHGWMVGLGAQNPKGHAACVLMAAEALASVGADLPGRVIAGFGCLGMPVNRRAPHLRDGHGAGCEALIDTVRPAAAVIAKSGWAVSWSEVGLAWFTVRVSGIHTYAGSRHLLPYRSAIAGAADLILDVESWIEEWAEVRSDEFNRPQGIVAAVRGGDPSAAAFTGCTCEFTVDLRIPPGIDADSAERALAERVDRRAAAAGIDATVTRTVAIGGTCTDPSEPVVRAAVKSWEAETGQLHQPIRGLSGATDANILRADGIPTARVGLPKVSKPGVDVDFQYGMNAVAPGDQVALSRLLIRTVFGYFGGDT